MTNFHEIPCITDGGTSGLIFCSDEGKPYQQPEATTIYQLLSMRAEKKPSAIAIAALDRPPLTYGALLAQVERTKEALHALGLSRNDRVALVLPNGPEMAVAFIALAAGTTCAPLNPSYRAREFDFYLSDLKANALIVSSEMSSTASEVARRRNIPIIELTPTPKDGAGTFELTGEYRTSISGNGFAQPDDVALLLHTSGTTSRPKLVPLTHTNICTSAHNIALTLELTRDDRCLNVMPLFHIHGLIGALLASLTVGASIICTPGLDAARFFAWLESLQPSWYTAVPTMHQAILTRASMNRSVIARCPLRLIRSCSAQLPARAIGELEDAFNAPVIEAYGMTEAAHQMTSNPLTQGHRKPGSVGIPTGPQVAIMDEAGHLLPIGQVGEVVIRGPNVMRGYENNPTANRTAFTNEWFRTGDQGRFDRDGYLFLTGRLKEIINRGGEKIAPLEVDAVLAEHPAVAQAISFAVPHATLQEDVAAAVVLREKAIVTERDIREFAAARLADFKVPSQVLIIDELPKGSTGKIQRSRLADMLKSKLQQNLVAPSTPVEKELVAVWRDLLHVDQFGVRDNFYALGGDSLALAGMLIEIENRFNVAIPVDSFLESPTIETLTKFLQKHDPSISQPSIVGRQLEGLEPLRDSMLVGLKNRLLQLVAFCAPGRKTTRVQLHRLRGVSIGKNVSIGLSVLIETAYPRLVSIGNNVTIGMRVLIIAHLRDLTTPALAAHQPTVRVEDNAYIGPGVIVMPNVTIGHGAVVSAGSVVSGSVPPQTLVRGNPARPIAHCGVSLGGGVSYEQFLRHLTPIKGQVNS